jgi:PAS domain S-box-containing protein
MSRSDADGERNGLSSELLSDDKPPGTFESTDHTQIGQHENDQRLLESEARFRAAINAIEGVLWTNSADGRMVGEQRAWAKLTGQSFDDYQDYGWAQAVHPDDAQPTIDAWNASVATRTPFNFEHRVRCHDGEWRRFAIRAIPVLDDEGRIREWVGIHTDITLATAQRAQLARNAETFESLVRNNPFGIYVVGPDFRLLQISDGAQKVFSTIDNAVGRDFAEIMRMLWTEPFASEAIARFRTTLATGEPYINRDTIEQRADIEAVEAYDWRIERIALPDGSEGVVCYFYDFSERMKLEEDLRQAVANKDLLAREIEHRVQNSLAIVAGLLTLQRAAASTDAIKDALATASGRVLAIGRVHRQLYKGENVGVVEFGHYLRQLCTDIEQTMGHSKLSFDVQTEAVNIPVDTAVPLGIIANELLTNACKHCNPEPDACSITVILKVQTDGLTLTVSNTGRGVSADFTPHRNSGLGLQVIDALVRQIDGKIAYPQPSGEARFDVSVSGCSL